MADSGISPASHIANAASPLLSLPLEILLRITYYLKTDELCKVRLCCKLAEELLLGSFTREYFSRRQFALVEPSVKAFVDISKSRFRHHLTAVHVSIETLTGFFPSSNWNITDETPRVRDLVAMNTLLWTSGQLTELLATGFQNLPNLKAVVVRSRDSDKRYRDYPNTRWRSWGLTTLSNNFQHYRISFLRDSSSATKTFQVILMGLAKANIKLEYLEVMAPDIHDEAYLVSPYMAPQIKDTLHNVSRLHLWLGSEQHPYHGISQDHWNVLHSSYMCDFLSAAPNVTDLRLNAGRGVIKPVVLAILERLVPKLPDAAPDSESNGQDKDSNWIVLPKLEILSLGFMTLSAESLLSLLQRFSKQLKDLSLWKVEMHTDGGIQNDTDDEDKKPLWWHFLHQLRDIDLELGRLSIGSLRERQPTGPQKNVLFSDKPESVSYQGPVWKSFIGDILPHISLVNTRPAQLYAGMSTTKLWCLHAYFSSFVHFTNFNF